MGGCIFHWHKGTPWTRDCTRAISHSLPHGRSKPLWRWKRLTFHCDIIHRQLQALASPHHLHSVPLVVVQLLPRKQCLWSFACCGRGKKRGIRIINGTLGSLRAQLVHAHTHTNTRKQFTQSEQLSVLEEKTCMYKKRVHRIERAGVPQNGNDQIFSLTDCKIECLLCRSQCYCGMSSKDTGTNKSLPAEGADWSRQPAMAEDAWLQT